MKIKITEKYYTSISPCNTRQWCMELLRQPGVEEIRGEEYADIGINVLDNVGTSVCIDTSDIQSLVHCYDVDKTIVPEIATLVKGPLKKPSVVYAGNNSRGIDYIDRYDYYANIISPWTIRQLLEPKLKHAKTLELFHALPEDVFFMDDRDKKVDVFFMGSMRPESYPLRTIFHEAMCKENNITYLHSSRCGNKAKHYLYGTQEEKMQQYDKQMFDFAEYLRCSRSMLLGSSIYNIALKKYIECMATGCLVLAPYPKDGKAMGFKDGENMVVVNERNFRKKLHYYLGNEEERLRITSNAYKLYKERHTLTKSVKSFLKQIKK